MAEFLHCNIEHNLNKVVFNFDSSSPNPTAEPGIDFRTGAITLPGTLPLLPWAYNGAAIEGDTAGNIEQDFKTPKVNGFVSNSALLLEESITHRSVDFTPNPELEQQLTMIVATARRDADISNFNVTNANGEDYILTDTEDLNELAYEVWFRRLSIITEEHSLHGQVDAAANTQAAMDAIVDGRDQAFLQALGSGSDVYNPYVQFSNSSRTAIDLVSLLLRTTTGDLTLRSINADVEIKSDIGSITITTEGVGLNLSLLAEELLTIRNSNGKLLIKSGTELDLSAEDGTHIQARGATDRVFEMFSNSSNKTASLFLRTESPEGVTPGNGGDRCIVEDPDNPRLFIKFGDSSNTGWRETTILSTGSKQIFSSANLDVFETAGVLNMPDGHFLFMEDFTETRRFAVPLNGNVIFEGYSQNFNLTMSNTGILFSGKSKEFRLLKMRILVTGSGSQLFDIECERYVTQRFEAVFDQGNQSIGKVVPTEIMQCLDTLFQGFADGILWENTNIFSMSDVVMISTGLTANTMISLSKVNGPMDFNKVAIFAGPSESLFDIDPTDEKNVNIDNVQDITGLATYFKTGSTGDITQYADTSIATTSITSVTDSGGIARFNFTVGPTLFVGQTITLSGYVTNTAYNVTGEVTVTGAGFVEISSIAFGTNEAGGSVDAEILEITSASNGLSDLELVRIRDTLKYDIGRSVFNALTNTFEVSAEFFTDEATGFFDTGSLTEIDPNIIVTKGDTQPDSEVSGEINLIANAVVTDIPAGTVGALVMIASSAGFVGTDLERIFVTAEGVSVSRSRNLTTLKLDANVTMEPDSSTKELSSTFFRQDTIRKTVTFTNGTNLINETGTALVNGDQISFNFNDGTLPAELREDIVFFVINQLTNSFQVSYTLGGSAVTFTDDGSGTNTYAAGETHGSQPMLPIAANNPRSVTPQALAKTNVNELNFLVVSNQSDAVNILISAAYYRVFK